VVWSLAITALLFAWLVAPLLGQRKP